MIHPEYPRQPFRIRNDGETAYIFDDYRKSWVKLTPEEWVRQNFLQWMVMVMEYPAGMIAVEKEIRLHELNKRFDILVYGPGHQPWMMVECKAPSVPLSEKVMMQVLRYNIAVPVHYLVITNGVDCIAVEREGGMVNMLAALPEYPENGHKSQ